MLIKIILNTVILIYQSNHRWLRNEALLREI